MISFILEFWYKIEVIFILLIVLKICIIIKYNKDLIVIRGMIYKYYFIMDNFFISMYFVVLERRLYKIIIYWFYYFG